MKKSSALLIILLISVFRLLAVTVESDSLRNFLYGSAPNCSYDNYVSHIAEGIARPNYNIYSPWEIQSNDFGAFNIPTDIQLQQWQAVYNRFVSLDLEAAEALIDSFAFPYEVVEFNDLESANTYYLLRENVDYQYYDDNGTPETYDDENGAFHWGWGLYIYNPQAQSPVIISVPHPNDDFITIPVGFDCLLEFDAMFMFVSGAGREVEWTEIGSYSNGKSISDPTRNDDHPQIVACRIATDLIRQSFRREFSIQIHSYDWNRHANRANCQVSVVHNNPNLPVRDLSNLHYDLINQGSEIMIDANLFGDHSASSLNDYYAVYYSRYPFFFYGDEDTLAVNNNVDLTGVGGAFLDFATEDWNSYDVYDPFFHLEMDELPNQYTQNTYQYYNFYGYNSLTETWDADTRYEIARGWYQNWYSDLAAILPDVLQLDDAQIPVAVDSIFFDQVSTESIVINWQPQPCYDFLTYRVFYDTTAIDTATSPYFDRYNESFLASPLAAELEIEALLLNTEYNFMIATLDYNGNTVFSESCSASTSPAEISQLESMGLDNSTSLYWQAIQQNGNQGFNVYRRQLPSTNWILLDSWQTNPLLLSSNIPNENFLLHDNSALNNNWYAYKISCVNLQGNEFFPDNNLAYSLPSPVYDLTFSHNSIYDSISFCYNYYASDQFDQYYDLAAPPYNGEDLYCSIYHPEWSDQWIKRDVKENYNLNQEHKTWQISLFSNFSDQDSLHFILENSFPDYYEIKLLDNNTGILYDLQNPTDQFLPLDIAGNASLTLYAGEVTPSIEFVSRPPAIYQDSEQVITHYSLSFPQLINSFSLSLINSQQQITVLDSITTINDSLVWTAPPDVTIHEAYELITYIDEEGISHQAIADYPTGIVPDHFEYSLSPGWHNISSICDTSFSASDLFGEQALLMEYTDPSYQTADSLIFGNGYWLDTPVQQEFIQYGSICGQAFSQALSPGWNLLPNPFPAPFEVQSLLFDYLSWNLSFRQIAEMGKISPQVYAYRDTIFSSVNSINPGEAFYLYNLADQSTPITAQFLPYQNYTQLSQVIPDWLVSANLSQLNDNSCFTLGSVSASSDIFDPLYDLPALPAKPLAAGCQTYLTVMGVTYPQPRMKTIFTEPFIINEEKCFDFIAQGSPEHDLELDFDLQQLPLDYYASLTIDSLFYDLDLQTDFSLVPNVQGRINGSISLLYPRVWYYGDVDKSDGVEAFDAALVLQYSVGIDPYLAPLPWLQWRFITADVDGNDDVDSYDAALILQFCIDMIEDFPANSRNNVTKPEAEVKLIATNDNCLQIVSLGNVLSIDLQLPRLVVSSEINNPDILWFENDSNSYYKLALASPHPLPNQSIIAQLNLNRIPLEQEISLKVNGSQFNCQIDQDQIPPRTQLFPLYPNPLIYNKMRSNCADISFSLANPQKIKINIYNIKGQLVKSLTNDHFPAGIHHIKWALDNNSQNSISSGIYFIQLKSPDHSSQRKFIILK